MKNKDIIDIITPSYGVSNNMMPKILNFIEKELGLDYLIRPYWQQEYHPLYAHSNTLRLESLIQALTSDHKIIWASRGGSGMALLIPQLKSWAKTLTSPPSYKLLIGFSDITALHLFLNQEWGWPTLHAPTLSCISRQYLNQDSIEKLKDFLFSKNAEIFEKNLLPLNDHARQDGLITGPLIGGNNSIVHYSIGTSWQLKAQDKIIFLEDVDEDAYRIDLRLQHFYEIGIFQGAKALILGDFNHFRTSYPKEIFNINYVLQTFAEQLSIPVFKMPDYGHTSQNKPLILGSQVYLKTGSSPSLRISFNQP